MPKEGPPGPQGPRGPQGPQGLSGGTLSLEEIENYIKVYLASKLAFVLVSIIVVLVLGARTYHRPSHPTGIYCSTNTYF